MNANHKHGHSLMDALSCMDEFETYPPCLVEVVMHQRETWL